MGHFSYSHFPASGIGHRDPRRPHVTGGLGSGIPIFVGDLGGLRWPEAELRDTEALERMFVAFDRDPISAERSTTRHSRMPVPSARSTTSNRRSPSDGLRTPISTDRDPDKESR